ncbi:metal ABC transporter ATP-binding protein [Arachnia propionica]|uniref:Metal ABC transporter ATP-binding protein n=1 Tax=Arachnia propionica TaxID=1750 RepID=A0A3P1T8G8_9ACTN|nr:metal ABC transporter ATP-binding protein [Arachnia propionica]MDO5083392.1 metal ABC transporter ATP-binding protein [Arachnia propionica]RRD04733.1 metal ABC transporter ATP-binding protein [Arachnia propionica]
MICSVRGLSVAYRDAQPVLLGVDLDLAPGTLLGVVGPNGAGKSTLIKAMLGIVTPLAGTVEFMGQPLDKVRNRVAYMPQTASVDWDFPTTVRGVVQMGVTHDRGWWRRPSPEARAAADDAMQQCGVADLADRQIGELSGGQQQRTFLARALASRAELYFMDEPFQGVDAPSQRTIMRVLREIRDSGASVIVVHHDLGTVPEFCDEVMLLNRSVVSIGPLDEAFTEETISETYRAHDPMELAGVL